MIHQIRYLCKTSDVGNIAKARSLYGQGLSLDLIRKATGVVLEPLAWNGDSTRSAVRTGFIGPAGIVKRYARPDQTLCDIDEKQPPAINWIMRIARMLKIRPRFIEYDRTKHGWHVIIEWSRRFKPIEICALQCVLGSDLDRETYNLARIFSGKARNRRWNLLFERKLS